MERGKNLKGLFLHNDFFERQSKKRRISLVNWRLSDTEYKRRIERLRCELARRGLSVAYLTNGTSFWYFSGFAFYSTERPAALVIPIDGDVTYMGPVIEQEHIQSKTNRIANIKVYRDYPGTTHPIGLFGRWLTEMGLSGKTFGVEDSLGAPDVEGYRGPLLNQMLPNAKFESIKDFVEDMWMFKSDEEIALAKESAKWGNLAHSLLQDYTEPGLYDWEISSKATVEASLMMKKALGPDYYPIGARGGAPVSAGFRGQIGSNSALPHAMACPYPIREGDVLVTGVGADVGGIGSELERTMIAGEPTDKQRKFFNVMLEAQDAALALYKPGIKLSDIDKAVMAVFKKHDALKYERHHTGHGLGPGIGHYPGHHKPFVDQGEESVILPRMSFSCEPGIYIPGLGGFRHADHIIITEDDSERITYYPRDLESLTIRWKK